MATDQVTAVKHRLLHAQYLQLAARTQFPVELLQQLAESCAFDLQEVEAGIGRAMKAVTDSVMANLEREYTIGFIGGNAGGGKVERMQSHPNCRCAPPGVVHTCTA